MNAGSILVTALLFLGCAPGHVTQEPLCRVAMTTSGNVVCFGDSVANATSQALVLEAIDARVAGRLPGVKFYVVHYPALVVDQDHVVMRCHSWRDPQAGKIMLSWWVGPDGWTFGDLPWEVEHMVAGTLDDGHLLTL